MAGRRILAFTLASLAGLALARSALAAPAASCRAERAGHRALVTAQVRDLLEPELLRLVELGLMGRLRIEAVLFRKRRLWFDERVAEEAREWAVGWSRAERALVVNGQLAPPAAGGLPLPEVSLVPARFEGGGHYVEVNLRLEVVSSSSLGEVARWLVAAADTTVPRALVDYLAADLARTSQCRCPVEEWQARAL